MDGAGDSARLDGPAAAPFAYVANQFSNNVSVIATATLKLGATVTVGLKPSGIAFTPDGTQAYVANRSDGTVSVIDAASNAVVGTPIPVGLTPVGIASTLDGKHAYVANEGSGDVSVIRAAKQKVVATVPVGTNPFGVGSRPCTMARAACGCEAICVGLGERNANLTGIGNSFPATLTSGNGSGTTLVKSLISD